MQRILVSVVVLMLMVGFGLSAEGQSESMSVTTSAAEPTAKRAVTVVDHRGEYVAVQAPVERIVTLSPNGQEVMAALTGGKPIVGYTSLYSGFPSYMNDKTAVGDSPGKPNVELVFQLRPDLVIADTHILKNDDLMQQIESTGTALYIERPHPDNTATIIRNLGLMVDKMDRANKIVEIENRLLEISQSRVRSLEAEEKKTLYWEASWSAYTTPSGASSTGGKIRAAGAVNIAENEPGLYPKISPEYVLEENPAVIIGMIPSSADRTLQNMKAKREEIMARPELRNVSAVKNGRVYIITWDVLERLSYPVGLLYLGSWLYPELFADVEPARIHEELITELYGAAEWGGLNKAFVYPSD